MEEKINSIITGDCMDVLRSIPNESIDMVITDPPYGISYCSSRKTKERQFAKIHNDNAPFIWWIYDTVRTMKQMSGMLCFARWDTQQIFIDAMVLAGLKVKTVIIWDKMTHSMGDLKGSFSPRYESIIFAVKGRYTFPGRRPDNIICCRRVAPQKLIHPTEKPIDLLKSLVDATTRPNDLILDPFAGSGSTLVAASQAKRRYIGIEIDKNYSNIASRRVAQIGAIES